MPSLTIKLSKQLSARVARLARERKVSRSEVVRAALEALPEGADRTITGRFGHLFGAGKKGPTDLSTNPKHLKGYGA
jgi:hypothetical protein